MQTTSDETSTPHNGHTQRAFVQLDGKKEFILIKEGWVEESSVSSAGPQQVLGKIKNEIKAGNPVTWEWRFAAGFKKKKDEGEGKEGAGEKKAVPAGPGDTSKDDAGVKKDAVGKGPQGGRLGGAFPFSLPAPPKSL